MKVTFSGAELREHAKAGGLHGAGRNSAAPSDAVRTVMRLIEEARRYGLRGVDMLDKMPIEQVVADYNGIGPAFFPPSMRKAIDSMVPDLRCAALIHDVRWAHSDGSVEQFNASNVEFEENGAVVASAVHKWHPLRRIRLKSVAHVFADLCSGSVGWSAYLAASHAAVVNPIDAGRA